MTQPSNPGWATGFIPTAQEWAQAFSSKVDFPAPVGQGGTGGLSAFSGNYNLQQRVLISATATELAALSIYGVRTALGAFEVLLPPVASLQPGDWLELLDVDSSANTNPITVTASGTDDIVFQGTTAGAQVLSSRGSLARLTVNGEVGSLTWSMVVLTAYQSLQYRVGSFFIGTPSGSETLVIHPVTSACTFPAAFLGSVVKCGHNPAAAFVMTVYRNPVFTGDAITGGTAVGTITVSTGGAVTFATTGGLAQAFAAGDVLAISAPATPDISVACTGITLEALLGA